MTTESNQQWSERRKQAVTSAVGNVSLRFIESASGAVLRDVEGNDYLDFAGGIGAMNIGHSHHRVVAALKAQAEHFTHTCFMVNPYPSLVQLAERLGQLTPGDFPKKTAFFNSGAEGVENAVKIARHVSHRPAVIVFDNAYHGRTLLTMTMTAKVMPFKKGFGPFAPEIYRMPFADRLPADKLGHWFTTHIDPESVAAIVAEPVQGEGGFIAPGPDYFPELHRFCRQHGILLVMDEIQSGMGRTGKLFACEHWGVEPDMVIVGKSLAAGMPLSAVVGRAEILDGVHVGGLGGTYCGNPLACAAALAVLDVFETEPILERAAALGERLGRQFAAWHKRFAMVGGVRGLGAMLGFELVTGSDGTPATDDAKRLIAYCEQNGLILLVCGIYGNIVRCLAPLVITDEQLETGLAILESGLEQIHQQ